MSGQTKKKSTSTPAHSVNHFLLQTKVIKKSQTCDKCHNQQLPCISSTCNQSCTLFTYTLLFTNGQQEHPSTY